MRVKLPAFFFGFDSIEPEELTLMKYKNLEYIIYNILPSSHLFVRSKSESDLFLFSNFGLSALSIFSFSDLSSSLVNSPMLNFMARRIDDMVATTKNPRITIISWGYTVRCQQVIDSKKWEGCGFSSSSLMFLMKGKRRIRNVPAAY